MPLIIIRGISKKRWAEAKSLKESLKTRLEKNKDEFKISKGATSIFFSKDILDKNFFNVTFGKEIIVYLHILEKEGRTQKILKATADAIVETIRKHEAFKDIPLIECFTTVLPRETFSQSKL